MKRSSDRIPADLEGLDDAKLEAMIEGARLASDDVFGAARGRRVVAHGV